MSCASDRANVSRSDCSLSNSLEVSHISDTTMEKNFSRITMARETALTTTDGILPDEESNTIRDERSAQESSDETITESAALPLRKVVSGAYAPAAPSKTGRGRGSGASPVCVLTVPGCPFSECRGVEFDSDRRKCEA